MRRRLAVLFVASAMLFAGPVDGQAPALDAPAPDHASALASLEALQTRRARVDAEIEALVSQRGAARERLRERVAVLYRLRRAGVLPLAGGLEALLRHQSRVTRLERMVERDLSAAGTLRRRVAALSADSARLADEVEAAEREAEASRRHELTQQQSLQALASMIEDPGAWSGPSAQGFGLRLSDGAPLGGLAAARGQLPLPIDGAARIEESTREGGEGLELGASPGAAVRAVAAGRVAYAAPHPAYRRLVIVDHGDGHFTVYGGLGAIAVGVGQPVGRGGALGSVGDEPLFFQIRRGSRPLSARAWLGL